MPTIESQKNCPIDLKEAISSVIFATPRCLDIPELANVRKQIMAKYGKEFVSAAVELRPDCGVNRLAIVGPNTLEKATYVEPPQLHVPPVGDEKGPPNLSASYQLKEMKDVCKNSYEKNASLNSSGTGSQEMDFGNMSAFQKGRQNWNMEFKDAASAAQVAAESAERASMAARAAAELSNREKLTMQYSSGWNWQSPSDGGELPQEYAFHSTKYLSAGYVNSTIRSNSFEIHNEQTNAREQHNLVASPNEHYMNSNENVMKRYQKRQGEANKKSSTRDSNECYDSENGLPEQISVTLASHASDLSRRMLVPSKTSTSTFLSLKGDPLSKASKTFDAGLGEESSRVSYESIEQKVSFMENWASSEHGSAEHAASKPSSVSKSEEILTLSSARVQMQPSSSLTKTMIPEKEQASMSLNSNKDIPSKEKGSHVHPKLPDYDTFAAQFLSRKKGR
uniref:Uncharacterized protein n=1 Tax=Cajanus cajan TaxID=3821 RepID=A0A151TKF3_CAJCA|nr:hypothetical protein KK1_023863 [Cajanus cajan]